MPKTITKNGYTTEFAYDPDRARYKRIDTGSQFAQPTTTLYLGNVEIIYHADGTVEWKRSIGGVAILIQKFDSNGVETAQSEHYLLKDHLGSINLVTNAVGEVIEEMDFDPWGKRRDTGTWEDMQDEYKRSHHGMFADPKPVTHRGYTGHEALDEVGLIHMNGRIYDDTLARFVQADPIIQDPYRTQSLNRYSYVWNNPLNATDPSGFEAQQCSGTNCIESPPPSPVKDGDKPAGSGKVTLGINSCASGDCQNYKYTRNGMSYKISIDKAETEAFEKEFSKALSNNSLGNSAGKASSSGVSGESNSQVPATIKSQDAKSAEAAKTASGNDLGKEPSWLKIARGETGQKEVAGDDKHNKRIIEYHSKTSLAAEKDEIAWCSSFCNWVMSKDGKTGTNSAAAKSWLKWGDESKAVKGALAVVRRKGADENEGYHVGFLIEETKTYYKILGGNQKDQVKISTFSKERWELEGYRWPDSSE